MSSELACTNPPQTHASLNQAVTFHSELCTITLRRETRRIRDNQRR